LSVTETVLYFVVIPGVAVLVIAGLAMAGGGRGGRRYRPGRSFDFTPVWFLSAPELLSGDQSERREEHAALPAGERRAEIAAAGERTAEIATTGKPRVPAGSTGGASDRW
jgi:hypothetical protein